MGRYIDLVIKTEIEPKKKKRIVKVHHIELLVPKKFVRGS